MRVTAFSTGLTIGIGFAIAFSGAIPRAAAAGPASEPQTDFSRGDQTQFQKFALWRDRHGVTGETCLSQPEGAAAPGSRWYYHVDAATQRHCWYQKQLGAAPSPAHAAKTSRAQAPDSADSKHRARSLPLTAAGRETLFRQFQQWREDHAPE
jgi:hypothetical protein